ncbi:MAG: D-glycero-beta-D-manno-heptose 1-phosphate adenylyltransferase [Bacteroidia bacterium]|nr:D-glycero-beta-D-manno-heptose 1-phosphate adenylyltransferase [Bacteroidia bacterium]
MYQTSDKILPLTQLQRRINAWRVRGETIVFTNGCFDLLHLGHVDYLEKAQALGDRLVIGLNSDTSVRQLKGENRPFQDENTRARLLAAMEFVDAVYVFPEETPRDLIALLQPDVLVKGADYQPEEVAGAELLATWGGRLELIPLTPDTSTSSLADRIRNQG